MFHLHLVIAELERYRGPLGTYPPLLEGDRARVAVAVLGEAIVVAVAGDAGEPQLLLRTLVQALVKEVPGKILLVVGPLAEERVCQPCENWILRGFERPRVGRCPLETVRPLLPQVDEDAHALLAASNIAARRELARNTVQEVSKKRHVPRFSRRRPT